MAGPAYAVTPSDFRTRNIGFSADNTTAAKVAVETNPAALASGSLPAYSGGATVIDLVASSSDAASKDIIVYEGEVLATNGVASVGALATTATVNGTVTDAGSQLVVSGFKVGDQMMIFAPDGTAQAATGIDGLISLITAVAAGTITINGVTWAANGALTAGTRLVRVTQLFRATIAANAGNTNAIANTKLLGNAMDNAAVQTEKKLGSNGMLIVGLAAAMSAKPAAIGITATFARY